MKLASILAGILMALLFGSTAQATPYPYYHRVAVVSPGQHHWYRHHHYRRHQEARHRAAPERPRREAPRVPAAAKVLEAAKAKSSPTAAAVATQAMRLGSLLGIPEGWEDGISAPKPPLVVKTPPRHAGVIAIGGSLYNYVSGGAGFSIPYGNYRITPEAIGPIGRRLGAIGIANGEIPDKRLGRMREGIELHRMLSSGRTAGCVGVDRWAEFKRNVFAIIDQFGGAYLHMDPRGSRVSPAPEPVYVDDVRIAGDGPRRTERRHYVERQYRHHTVRYAAHAHHHRQHYARA